MKTETDTNAASGPNCQRRLVRVPTYWLARKKFFNTARKCVVCGVTKKTFAYDNKRGSVCSPACLVRNLANVKHTDPETDDHET